MLSYPIDLEMSVLNGRDLTIAKGCLGRGNSLRSSKPKDGETAYVWRMVAYMISKNPTHHCMPVGAEFYLPSQYWGPSFRLIHDGTMTREQHQEKIHEAAVLRRARIKELDKIVDAIVDLVPFRERHGINRWKRAFGL